MPYPPADRDPDDELHIVVVSGEGHYQIWPAAVQRPAGWFVVSRPQTRIACFLMIAGAFSDDDATLSAPPRPTR